MRLLKDSDLWKVCTALLVMEMISQSYVGNLAGNPWPFLLMVSVTRFKKNNLINPTHLKQFVNSFVFALLFEF